MSWIQDRQLGEALQNFASASAPHVVDTALLGFGKTAYGGADSSRDNLAVFTPMHPSASMCMAQSCSFETSGLFDLYVQWTANSSALTFTDMYYIGRFDAETNTNDHSPPTMYFSFVSAASFASVGAAYHVISKNGWMIGGISFASCHVMGRFA